MSLPVHVVPSAALASASPGSVVRLDGDEGRHAAAVRRLRVGESLELVDGQGVRALGSVIAVVDRSSLDVKIERVVHEPLPQPRVVVAQALAKGDRGELAVELMTEVGVDAIVPWQASRCVVRWDSAAGGLARWRRTAVEASKQARRARVTDIAEVASTAGLVEMVTSVDVALILDEEAPVPLADFTLPAVGDVLLVVGPEGGITPDERQALENAGACAVRLGPTVMRTSTAGAAAAAVVLAATGRWGLGGLGCLK